MAEHRRSHPLVTRVAAGCLVALAACQAPQGMDTPDAAAPDAAAPDAAAPDMACTVMAPTACPDPAPRYPDVQPIFAQRCVPCHSGRGELWPLTSYEHVADWYDIIRDAVLSCAMPPPEAGVPITNEERLLILTWLRCGFPR